MPTRTPKPPTAEQGIVTHLGTDANGLISWAGVVDERETNRELTFPNSVHTYRKMRSTDAQIAAILAAITVPIRRFQWMIDPNGARDEVVELVARDLNLPIRGAEDEPKQRSHNRFSHDRHLAAVLRGMLTFGFQFHEQVAMVDDAGRYRLRKLAERPGHTITDIEVASDGGLVRIRQGYAPDDPTVDVSRLVAYVWQQEAGKWTGESLLRPMYRPYKIKDRILRVGAINIERAGGVPYVEAAQGANQNELKLAKQFAQQFRVGENGGGALPFGWQLKFAQAAGGAEAAEYVRLQNEEMARAALAMFLLLGQTETGSRALGSEFIDFFSLQLDTVAGGYVETTNEHVITDLVDWNFGADEQVPMLTYDRDPNPQLSVDDLATLVSSGMLVVDNDLEDVIRGKYSLPDANREAVDAGASAGLVPPLPAAVDESDLAIAAGHAAVYAAKDPNGRVKLPSRPLRRLPNDVEIAAAMDLETLDETWQSQLDKLVSAWQAVRAEQIASLVDQIAAAKGVAEFDEVAAPPTGEDLLRASMIAMAAVGVASAADEAAAQGVSLPDPEAGAIAAHVAERAEYLAGMLADELTIAATREAERVAGPTFDSDAVAASVREHLESLSDSFLAEQFGGALTNAQNLGRAETMAGVDADEPVGYYSSEILDSSTCDECLDVDGKQYDTLAAAIGDYPTGTYRHCKGRKRCRGAIVARYAEGITLPDVSAARHHGHGHDVSKQARNNHGQFGTHDVRLKGNAERKRRNLDRALGKHLEHVGADKLAKIDDKTASKRKANLERAKAERDDKGHTPTLKKDKDNFTPRVTAKLGRMRDPQDFLVYQERNGKIMVQSQKSIGEFDVATGKGKLSTTGKHPRDLKDASAFQFPSEFVELAKKAYEDDEPGASLRNDDGKFDLNLATSKKTGKLGPAPLPKIAPSVNDPGPREARGEAPDAAYNNARLDALGFDPGFPPSKGARASELLGDHANSRDLYGHADGDTFVYTDPARIDLHARIIDHFLAGKTKPKGKPAATFMAGGSGAGKGTAQKGFDDDRKALIDNSVLIDPDEIKALLPEFRSMVESGDGYAAFGAHEESSDISKRLADEARSRGLNILFDGTGDNKKHDKFYNQLGDIDAAGYDVSVVMVNLPTETAVERAISRAFGDGDSKAGSGRMVPPSMIRDIHGNATYNHLYWRSHPGVARWEVYDTNVGKDEPARLLATGGRGEDPHIIDEEGYNALETKALTENVGGRKMPKWGAVPTSK